MALVTDLPPDSGKVAMPSPHPAPRPRRAAPKRRGFGAACGDLGASRRRDFAGRASIPRSRRCAADPRAPPRRRRML